MTQATLPLSCGRRLTKRERFERFRAARPEVERELVRLARNALFRGKRIGMRCLWETCRYEMHFRVAPTNGDSFKMNNNHAPFFARHLMATYPDLAGLFETRGGG